MRHRTTLVPVIAALVFGSVVSLSVARPALAAVCTGAGTSLADGGFETPAVPPDTFVQLPAASVPPWQTTDGAGLIELWGTGFNGVPAGQGNAFAELNATTAGTLYQDVVSTPGATMSWSLLHRARVGNDVMQVLIGDANVADVNGATGWNFISADLTDDTSAWGAHAGDYVVPAGQTCTRFAFRAVSTGSGNDSIGNFLDAVAFTVTIPPPPTPTPRPTPRSSVTVTSPPTDTLLVAPTDEHGASLISVAVVALAAVAGLGVLLARTRRSTPRR